MSSTTPPLKTPLSTEVNRIVQKLWIYCTVLRLPMNRPSRPALLIIENPAALGFSASCNEMHTIPHLPEPVRYCYFSYEAPSLVARAQPTP